MNTPVPTADDGGEVTTVAFELEPAPAEGWRRQQLQINAKADFGKILVELLPPTSTSTSSGAAAGGRGGRYDDVGPLPGYSAAECEPIQADGTALRVRWGTSPRLSTAGGGDELTDGGGLPDGGAAFRIRFRLYKARLYSYSAVPMQ